MRTTTLKPTKGRLLISVPFLNDYYFGRSVVLLTEHNDEGSVGLIVNKPLETTVNDAIREFPQFNDKLYMGGPVEDNSLFYLHTQGEKIPESVEIVSGLFWGGNFETIKMLIESGELTPAKIRFFVGYSGWSPFQLDRELRERSWVVADSEIDYIMNQDPESFWNDKLKKTPHKEYTVWADYPVNPSLN